MVRILPPILHRYVFREILLPFTISLLVFTGILFLARSLRLVDLVVNKNVPVEDILFLFSLIVPRFLELAAPMALLLGIIISFGRLSSDSELVVMRAAGIRLKNLLVPVGFFAFIVSLLVLGVTLWLRPWANYQLGVGMFEIAKMQASANIIGGVFNDFGPLTIYPAKAEENGNRLSNVMISDGRIEGENTLFIARHGQIVSEQENRSLVLRLFDGSIHQRRNEEYNVTYFDINNISLPLSDLSEQSPTHEGKKSDEMFIGELIQAIDDTKATQSTSEESKKELASYLVELHVRLALPVSCFCVALCAMALGVQPSRGGHTWGASISVAVGILTIVLYYLLFAVAKAIGEQGNVNPGLIMWIPNLLFFIVAGYFFTQVERERWLAVTERLGDFLKWASQKISFSNNKDTQELSAS